MAKSETIKIQDGDTIVELSGADKDTYLAQRETDDVQFRLVETEQLAKQAARTSAITKLAEIAGLTEEEINAII